MKVLGQFKSTVVNVEEHYETVRGWIDANGDKQVTTRSLGWFIRIGVGSSIWVGTTKPDVKIGDEIVLILTKKEGV